MNGLKLWIRFLAIALWAHLVGLRARLNPRNIYDATLSLAWGALLITFVVLWDVPRGWRGVVQALALGGLLGISKVRGARSK